MVIKFCNCCWSACIKTASSAHNKVALSTTLSTFYPLIIRARFHLRSTQHAFRECVRHPAGQRGVLSGTLNLEPSRFGKKRRRKPRAHGRTPPHQLLRIRDRRRSKNWSTDFGFSADFFLSNWPVEIGGIVNKIQTRRL
jgi:hypothetical protein